MSYFRVNNKWFEQKWCERCVKSEDPLSGRYYGRLDHQFCQGAIGHDGPCWRYSESGNLQIKVDGQNVKTVAPWQDGYVSPVQMAQNYYLHQGEQVEVTDEAVIQQLNLKHMKLLENSQVIINE